MNTTTTKGSILTRLLILGSVLAAAIVLPFVFAQPPKSNDGAVASATRYVNEPNEKPPSMKEAVQVMVEMSEVPAAVPYGEALKAARQQAESERAHAAMNPNAPGSQAILKNPKKIAISTADDAKVKNHAQRLDQAQQALLPSLTGGKINGRVLYRVQHAYNGIALKMSPNQISELSKLPGVKAVHPLHPQYLTAAFSDIDFLRTRVASGGLWTTGSVHGEGIKVAVIDSGLDYVHADFGGNANYTGVTDTNPNGHFPSAKVPGGYDFAGNAYNASDPAHDTPVPDTNPFDCGGHGTSCASLIGGYGENNDGSTYTGNYDATNPAMSSLKISPGFAPKALLYPLRVFGCAGSTNLTVQAIDWAIENHMDVISMSLGSDEGYADDPSAVAAANAAGAGIIVCSAAGNAGDSYYIHSSPAAASGTLSVAASFNDQNGFYSNAAVTGNSSNLAGKAFAAIFANTSPQTSVTGDVVYAQPRNGSTALTNAAQVAGHIVLIDRGVVTFSVKAQNAMAAGATGIIVVNNAGDPITQDTSTASPPLNIPDVMISTTDGATIKTAAAFNTGTTGDNGTGVPANPTNVTIAPGVVMASKSANPPGSAAGAGSPDTVPSYTARGPRLPDSALKPDITAPAEVVGVAVTGSGTGVANFNGTSSATPHVAGSMALLKQLHPTWSVQELNALACNTATHDLTTTVGGATKIGVGRVGAGRIDLFNAANSNSVAYNGSDPDQFGVSFGVVETPAAGSSTLTKNITLTNKGGTGLAYTLSIQNNPALAGAAFSFPNGTSVTVAPGTSVSVPVTFTATGNLLKHRKESSVAFQLPGPQGRQWLTEAGGYAVFTPGDGSPAIRVAVYAAPKPVSAMHTTATNFVVKKNTNGTVQLPLAGTPVNTGPNYGLGFDILSLAKPFELQYNRTTTSTDPNVLKYVGVTSDFGVNNKKPGDTIMVFGLEGSGNAPVPEFNSSDKEIFIDTDLNGTFEFVVFLSSIPNGTAHSNTYEPVLVDLKTNVATRLSFPLVTNLLDPVFNSNGSQGGKDTNSFNNSAILIPLPISMLLPANSQGAGAPTKIKYSVATFDRNGAKVDQTPLLTYDIANPGFKLEGGHVEPFYYDDLPTTSIAVQYDSHNFQANGSLGVWLVHMHNGDGLRSDVVTFTAN